MRGEVEGEGTMALSRSNMGEALQQNEEGRFQLGSTLTSGKIPHHFDNMDGKEVGNDPLLICIVPPCLSFLYVVVYP